MTARRSFRPLLPALIASFALAGFGPAYGRPSFGVQVQDLSVPEPHSDALMLAGLAGIGSVARRRSSAQGAAR